MTPDLTALGKAMGNGWTVAALAGRAELMDLLGTEVTMDGTYYANPYALAAARRAIELLEAGGIARMDPARRAAPGGTDPRPSSTPA